MFVDIINIGLFINNEMKDSRIAILDDSYLELRDCLLGIHFMNPYNPDQEIGLIKMVAFSDGDLLKIIFDDTTEPDQEIGLIKMAAFSDDLLKIISDDTTEEEKALLQKAIPYDNAIDELIVAEKYEAKQFIDKIS